MEQQPQEPQQSQETKPLGKAPTEVLEGEPIAPEGARAAGVPISRRRTILRWGAIGLAVVLVAVGIPLGVMLGEHIGISQAAQEDAAAIVTARNQAAAASEAFDETAALALAYAETAAIPLREAVVEHEEDFGAEQAEALAESVEAFVAAMERPLPAPGTAADQVDRAEQQSDAAAATGPAEGDRGQEVDALQEEEREGEHEADPWELTLGHPVERPEQLISALWEHYRSLTAEQREQARADAAAEAARFDGMAAALNKAEDELRQAVDGADAAILAAVASVHEVAPEMIESLEHASEESLAELRGAVDALVALSSTELPIAWEQRSLEQPTALGEAVGLVQGYADAADEARKSHRANTPAPSRQGYACYRWSPYGTYLAWCY